MHQSWAVFGLERSGILEIQCSSCLALSSCFMEFPRCDCYDLLISQPGLFQTPWQARMSASLSSLLLCPSVHACESRLWEPIAHPGTLGLCRPCRAVDGFRATSRHLTFLRLVQPVPVIQVPEPGYPMPPGFQKLEEPERREGFPIPFPMPAATTMPMTMPYP